MNVHDHDGLPGRPRPFNSGRSSTGGSHSHSILGPMAIPGSQRGLVVPPPLPPPIHVNVDDYAAGSSPRWNHPRWAGDSQSEPTLGKPKGPSSASALESFPKSWGRSMLENRAPEQPDYRRRESDSVRSPMHPRYDPSSRLDEGYYSLSVGPNCVNQQSV